MAKIYRVTQLDQWGSFVHSQDYKWRWLAHLSAWIHAGPGIGGGARFSTVIREVNRDGWS